ncbi:MAG: hypothetical protein WC675_00130 [Patescibacteria group bacterium]|jgi:VIT1/CCC1 family predicted Fe2+/Mn2+ transporter
MRWRKSSIEESLTTGLSFGLTSATITTLGLMIGLNSSTNSRMVVIGGILTIAVADAFSDALGIHLAEESDSEHTAKEIWLSTVFTFLAKFLFALTFLLPVLNLSLGVAIWVDIIWGLLILSTLSFVIAKAQKNKPHKVIFEHLFIAIIVIFLANLVGHWIKTIFG